MTIIYSNSGDRDTSLLQAIWKGLNINLLITICCGDRNYNEAVDEALFAEYDTLILCGHGTAQGLLHPNLYSGEYIVHENNVHLIHARNVICLWCYASEFGVTHNLHGFFTGMFISNESEAEQHGITFAQSDYDDIDIDICHYEGYFNSMLNTFLRNNAPLYSWINKLSCDNINHSNIIGNFNFSRLRYYE